MFIKDFVKMPLFLRGHFIRLLLIWCDEVKSNSGDSYIVVQLKVLMKGVNAHEDL